MQWMADGIHDFTVTEHQKNPGIGRMNRFVDRWCIE